MDIAKLRELMEKRKAANKAGDFWEAVDCAKAISDALPSLIARLEAAEKVVEAARGIDEFAAKLLAEICEIRANYDTADSTDVAVSKKARAHYENALTLASALATYDQEKARG